MVHYFIISLYVILNVIVYVCLRLKMASLKMYYQNVCGLRTKTSDFYRSVCLNSYDVIAITETWLLESISDSELFDGRYLVFRRDRDYKKTQQEKGGGVLLAVRRDFIVTERYDWRSTAEDLWITISPRRTKPHLSHLNIHICVLYLCNENRGYSYNKQLENFGDKLNAIIMCNQGDEFIIVGDFNFAGNVHWISKESCAELHPINIIDDNVLNFINITNTCSLNQYNGEPNCNQRILDLVLSNKLVTVSACTDQSPVYY